MDLSKVKRHSVDGRTVEGSEGEYFLVEDVLRAMASLNGPAYEQRELPPWENPALLWRQYLEASAPYTQMQANIISLQSVRYIAKGDFTDLAKSRVLSMESEIVWRTEDRKSYDMLEEIKRMLFKEVFGESLIGSGKRAAG